jgi:aryl-alcohol dehydrogenase-like predicted oxidoreductase
VAAVQPRDDLDDRASVCPVGQHRALELTKTRRVEEVAHARGASMAQVALAWLLSKDGMSCPSPDMT